MNTKLRRQLRKRNRRLAKRIDKSTGDFRSPMIKPVRSTYELAEKQQAVACGGIATIMELIKQVGLRTEINRAAPVFKVYAPYDEADHVFNIALNLMAGGTCLEHLETRRNDEAYLDALGAVRIPDPTTAGDFCRRFNSQQLLMLMQGINRSRQLVWKQQPQGFLKQATIEADGTMVESCGQKKEGIGMNYKGHGHHPWSSARLKLRKFSTLPIGRQPPEPQGSAFYFDLAIEQCRKAGFEKITPWRYGFRVDRESDRWTTRASSCLVLTPCQLVELADSLENTQWTR